MRPYASEGDPVCHNDKDEHSPPSPDEVAIDFEDGSVEEQEGYFDQPSAGEEEDGDSDRSLCKVGKEVDEYLLGRRWNQSPLDCRDVVGVGVQAMEEPNHGYHGQQGQQVGQIVPLEAPLGPVTNEIPTGG